MGCGILNSCFREWQHKCVSCVPGLPLIHVVGAEKISRFAGDEVECRSVEVGQVCCESLRWPMVAARSLHRVLAAGLRLLSGAGPALNYRNLSEDRILNCD